MIRRKWRAAVKHGMSLDKPYLIEVFVENPAK